VGADPFVVHVARLRRSHGDAVLHEVRRGEVALAGGPYRIAALLLSLGYLAAAVRFVVHESRETARGLLYSSLVYLPTLLAVLTWDHLRLLS